MKTFTKMFLLTCWCLLSVSFAKETLDEIKANKMQQLIQEKNEISKSQTQITKETKEEQVNPITVLKQEKGMKEIPVPNYSNDGMVKETLEPLSIEEQNKIEKEKILIKGYTVEEYIDAVNADRISTEKEGAVSFETYLEGLTAKEQAIILEYILQPVENTEGTIVTNTQTSEKVSINAGKEALQIQMEAEKAARKMAKQGKSVSKPKSKVVVKKVVKDE